MKTNVRERTLYEKLQRERRKSHSSDEDNIFNLDNGERFDIWIQLLKSTLLMTVPTLKRLLINPFLPFGLQMIPHFLSLVKVLF